MAMQQSLPGVSARVQRGACYSAVSKQLGAWSKQGHLTGDEHAADRQVLLEQGRAVDNLRKNERWAAAAQCAAVLTAQLREAAPEQKSDEFDEFLAGLAASDA